MFCVTDESRNKSKKPTLVTLLHLMYFVFIYSWRINFILAGVNMTPNIKVFWLVLPLIALCYAAKNSSSGGKSNGYMVSLFFPNISQHWHCHHFVWLCQSVSFQKRMVKEKFTVNYKQKKDCSTLRFSERWICDKKKKKWKWRQKGFIPPTSYRGCVRDSPQRCCARWILGR